MCIFGVMKIETNEGKRKDCQGHMQVLITTAFADGRDDRRRGVLSFVRSFDKTTTRDPMVEMEEKGSLVSGSGFGGHFRGIEARLTGSKQVVLDGYRRGDGPL